MKRIILPVLALVVLGSGGVVFASHSFASTVHAQGATAQIQKNQPSVAEKEVPDTQETSSLNEEKNQPDSRHTDPQGSVDHQFEGTE